MISKEKFLDIINEINKENKLETAIISTDNYFKEVKHNYSGKITFDHYLYSHWGEEESHIWGEENPDKELISIELILDEVFPKITYLQFRKLMRLAIKDTFYSDDYYDKNRHSFIAIKIQDIYDFCKKEM